MPKPTFEVRIGGPGVSPETTRASDLAKLVVDLEAAITGAVAAEGAGVSEEALVSLVNVEEGSNKLTIAVAATALSVVGHISHAIRSGDYEAIPSKTHEALYNLSNHVSQNKWTVSIRGGSSIQIDEAVVSEVTPVPPPPELDRATGTTAIYGRCVRVGGATEPKAMIVLQQGGSISIKLASERLARELARNLYEDVCIEGTAIWRTDGWSIESFEGSRITELRATDPATAFEQLAEAAGGRWDGLDVHEYVRSVRAEGTKA